jgi:hypothetical protein
MQDRIDAFNAKVIARGLAPREMEATFTTGQIFTTDGIYAPGLTHVAVEGYLPPPGSPTPQVNVGNLNSYLASAKARVRGAGKKMFLIMQAYNMSGQWSNITTLEALQRPIYLNAYNDPDVEGILMFNYGVPNGTKYIPQLQQAHREIGSAMRISPAMNIDAPAYNSTVSQPFHIGGWAIDRAAATGTGVDTLHVWAFPWSGAPPFILGAATYGGTRPDVAAAYGAQFQWSGWGINVGGMPPGWYTIIVYSHSSVSGLFNNEQAVVANVL